VVEPNDVKTVSNIIVSLENSKRKFGSVLNTGSGRQLSKMRILPRRIIIADIFEKTTFFTSAKIRKNLVISKICRNFVARNHLFCGALKNLWNFCNKRDFFI